MYQTLLFYHSLVRWLVLASLVYSIYRAYKGYTSNSPFSKTDGAVRFWTVSIANIQFAIGIVLYGESPIIKFFWKNFNEAVHNVDTVFFALVHMLLMLTALILISIGSALSKRKATDKEKFRTMLLWFSISLFLIFIAIPWPFSPLANRPYFR